MVHVINKMYEVKLKFLREQLEPFAKMKKTYGPHIRGGKLLIQDDILPPQMTQYKEVNYDLVDDKLAELKKQMDEFASFWQNSTRSMEQDFG